jgi:heme A synthase
VLFKKRKSQQSITLLVILFLGLAVVGVLNIIPIFNAPYTLICFYQLLLVYYLLIMTFVLQQTTAHPNQFVLK